jgi:hypothetical protein
MRKRCRLTLFYLRFTKKVNFSIPKNILTKEFRFVKLFWFLFGWNFRDDNLGPDAFQAYLISVVSNILSRYPKAGIVVYQSKKYPA